MSLSKTLSLVCLAWLPLLGGLRAEYVPYPPPIYRPSPPPYVAPSYLCNTASCPAGEICSLDFTCVKPPVPPPGAGVFSFTYYTDTLGHQLMIELHGSEFADGAAVSIIESWKSHNPDGSPIYEQLTTWSHEFSGVASFQYATGIQDCSQQTSPGAGWYGEPALIQVFDWAVNAVTYEIPIRAQFGGLCTAQDTA